MVGRRQNSERGVALLATLMAIALMALLVVDLTAAAALGYRSAANQANELRADYLARSGIGVGIALLAQDTRAGAQQESPNDNLAKAWAVPFPPIPLGGGMVSVSVVDEARKLSVNQLVNPTKGMVDPKFAAIFTRLFMVARIPPALLGAIVDWLDPDSITSPGGAEADYYLRLLPPYEPRNGPMPTIGDLRMISGVDEATFAKLAQFLTAAPETRVNVNTASPEVLAALLPEFMENPNLVDEIMASRQARPFGTITDVTNLPGLGTLPNLSSLLTTRGSYFTITGLGSFAGARKRVLASFRRNADGTVALDSWHED